MATLCFSELERARRPLARHPRKSMLHKHTAPLYIGWWALTQSEPSLSTREQPCSARGALRRPPRQGTSHKRIERARRRSRRDLSPALQILRGPSSAQINARYTSAAHAVRAVGSPRASRACCCCRSCARARSPTATSTSRSASSRPTARRSSSSRRRASSSGSRRWRSRWSGWRARCSTSRRRRACSAARRPRASCPPSSTSARRRGALLRDGVLGRPRAPLQPALRARRRRARGGGGPRRVHGARARAHARGRRRHRRRRAAEGGVLEPCRSARSSSNMSSRSASASAKKAARSPPTPR